MAFLNFRTSLLLFFANMKPAHSILKAVSWITFTAQLSVPSSKKSTETAEIILELIKSTFKSGEDVLISEFGKFCEKEKRERRDWNPMTEQDLILAQTSVVTSRCSDKLKERIK